MKLFSFIVVLFFLLTSIPSLTSADYVNSSNGDDAWNGTNPEPTPIQNPINGPRKIFSDFDDKILNPENTLTQRKSGKGSYMLNLGSLDIGITDLVFNNVIDDIERIALIPPPPSPFGIGWTVTSGDFNGDGLSDAVASGHNNEVRLYYGNYEIPTTPDQILTDPSGEGGFGFFVTSAGDVNNDGFDELIVVKDQGTERIYLYMGTSQGLSNTPDITLIPPSVSLSYIKA